jgi:carbamoyl-phosphate synthase large subunit
MASCARLACRSSRLLLRHTRPTTAPTVSCSLTTSTTIRYPHRHRIQQKQLRLFSQVDFRRNTTQEAPNAQAYLNSGAIAGARDLVNVKKVLVIGSGGLSIGQAGEFDYSGELHIVFYDVMSLQGTKLELANHLSSQALKPSKL